MYLAPHPQSDRFQFILGDCMEVLPHVPSSSVDMVLSDLPYGTTRCAWDTVLPLDVLWREYRRICRPAAPVVLFAQAPFDKVLGASNLAMLRYEWIWEKTHATGHLNARRAPLKAHENILVFYEHQPTYNPIKTTGHVRKAAKRVPTDETLYGHQRHEGLSYDSTERYPRSVQRFASDKQVTNLHPTQKPLALCEYLIRTYTNENDVVLDNCLGSGTTMIAARQCGRRAIGIEQHRDIFMTAVRRFYEDRVGSDG